MSDALASKFDQMISILCDIRGDLKRAVAASHDTVTEQEAAAILDCSTRTVRELRAQGKLPSSKVGRLRKYSRKKLLEMLQERSS